MRRDRIVYTEKELRDSIKSSFSWRQVIIKLGFVNDGGGNYGTVKRKAEALNIDYSHFKGKGWNLGGKANNVVEVIFFNGEIRKSSVLKKRILKENLLKYECCICKNNGEWLEKKITLEIDHIDGNKRNNTIENLRFLCPNCHSQTHSFRGRNKKYKRVCLKCGGKIWFKNKYGICEKCKFNHADMPELAAGTKAKNLLA